MQTMCAENEQVETQRLTSECARHAGIIVDAQRTVTLLRTKVHQLESENANLGGLLTAERSLRPSAYGAPGRDLLHREQRPFGSPDDAMFHTPPEAVMQANICTPMLRHPAAQPAPAPLPRQYAPQEFATAGGPPGGPPAGGGGRDDPDDSSEYASDMSEKGDNDSRAMLARRTRLKKA